MKECSSYSSYVAALFHAIDPMNLFFDFVGLFCHKEMSNFVRKGAVGRINAGRLHAFNETMKKDTLRPRSYWEEGKDSHPINRWTFKRWKARQDELSVFQEKFENVPVDQKFKIKKLMSVTNLAILGPVVLIAYLLFCWSRHKIYGLTPIDGATAIARGIQNLPRPPGY